MDALIVGISGIVIGWGLSFVSNYFLNLQNYKRDLVKLKLGYEQELTKLKVEHNKEVKVFTREKYEQLIIKLCRLAYMVYVGVHCRSRNEDLGFTIETFMMLMAEVDTMIMLHFPLLEEDYEKFSKQLIELYTEIFAGSYEQCEIIKVAFDREADNLLNVVKRNANEYTQIITS